MLPEITPRLLRIRKSAGDLDAPVVEWCGTRQRGYVWVGNEMNANRSKRPGRCALTLTKGQAKALRDWLNEALDV